MWRTIGQLKAIALFESGLKTGNLSHAYLLTGPSHIGKTTLALDLSQALNCVSVHPPCGTCISCKKILSGKHVDIQIIGVNVPNSKTSEAKSHFEIGIDEIRRIQQQAFLPPYEGKNKVFIIDGAEQLTNEAANCLLKILEEPPSKVVFLLLTTEITSLLPTIISRCQHIELRAVPPGEIEEILVTTRCMTDTQAKLLARLSQGRIGWALSASLDDSYLEHRRQALTELLPLLKAGIEERFSYAARFENNRKSAEETLRLWLDWWRDTLLVKNDCSNSITNVDFLPDLELWAQALSVEEISDFITRLYKSLEYISRNVNLRLVIEVLMLDMPREEETTRHQTLAMSG